MNNVYISDMKLKKKQKILLFFVFIIIVAIVVFIVYSIFDYKKNKIEIKNRKDDYLVGATYKLKAEFINENGDLEDLVYKSENQDIVDINLETGEMIGKKEGTTRIKIYLKRDPSIYEFVDINVKGE